MSATALRAIVGLGNPGADYARTRHNAGFWFVDRLAERAGATFRVESKFHGALTRARVGGHETLLFKPATFMNRSGQAVQALAQFYKLELTDLLIAHDELDLPAGSARLKLGGGHGGHNGLRDIHPQIGDGYRRLRIGIGHPGHKDLVTNYVLGRPSKTDETLMLEAIAAAIDAVDVWLGGSWEKAMQQLHTRGDPAPEAKP